MSNDIARFGERTPSKNVGPNSPMKKPSDWRNPPDPWKIPPPAEKGAPLSTAISPGRFRSPAKATPAATAAAAKAAEEEGMSGLTASAARYHIICKRLYVLPDPTYTSLLNGGDADGIFSEHTVGEYSTAHAKVALDPDGIFAIVATLELCRGLHTLRLTGLHRGGKPLLKKETLSAAVTALRTMASVRLLDLSRNMLDDDIAAAPLAKLLSNNASLTSLSLRSNDLSTGTAKSLLTCLSSNRTLVELDTSDNVELRWPGQGQEYAKLFKENVTINSFGASLSKDALSATLECFTKSAARMRRLALTMLPLGDKDMGALCGWLTNKQVRMRHDAARALRLSHPSCYL